MLTDRTPATVLPAAAHLLTIGLPYFEHLSLNAQAVHLEELNRIAAQSPSLCFEQRRGQALWLPEEDGITLAFFGDYTTPFRCAEEIAERLWSEAQIQSRMAIHTGPVRRNPDAEPTAADFGDARLLARKIMQCGDQRHILVSKFVAERLGGTATRHLEKQLQPVGTFPLAKGGDLPVYSFSNSRVGSSAVPTLLQPATAQQVPAYILFLDIVKFSLLKTRQTPVLAEFTNIVRNTPAFQNALAQNALTCCPTGDGMAIAFFNEMLAPMECARDIALAIRDHPDLRLRMGVHCGMVDRVANINAAAGESNDINGEAIITAQRVMSCGGEGHILVSGAMARYLLRIPSWSQSLRAIGSCQDKHGLWIEMYNYFTREIGNGTVPKEVVRQAADRVSYVVPPVRNVLPVSAPSRESSVLVLTVTMLLVGVGVLSAVVWGYGLSDHRKPLYDKSSVVSERTTSSNADMTGLGSKSDQEKKDDDSRDISAPQATPRNKIKNPSENAGTQEQKPPQETPGANPPDSQQKAPGNIGETPVPPQIDKNTEAAKVYTKAKTEFDAKNYRGTQEILKEILTPDYADTEVYERAKKLNEDAEEMIRQEDKIIDEKKPQTKKTD